MAHRAHIRDNLQARMPLGCSVFQRELKRGVYAITTSPDGHCVAILTHDLGVLVYDKIKESTKSLQPIDPSFYT